MEVRKVMLAMLLLIMSLTHVSALTNEESTKVRMVINLMDYIAKDYVNAVENGSIINEFEFAEMSEFADNAKIFFEELVSSGVISEHAQLNTEFDQLKNFIEHHESAQLVSNHAGKIREQLVAMKLVSLAPTAWPDLAKGKAIFQENCATCHGAQGKGDGMAAAGLSPAPTNFHEADVINNISPLQAFNTITLGIEGTAMVSYNHLPQQEIWDLAFYILSLQHEGNVNPEVKNTSKLDLEQIATQSNNKLLQLDPTLNIALIRTKAPEQSEDAIANARNYLSQSQARFMAADFDAATALALKAYLQGIEPIEPRIKASDNKLFEELESSMMDVRAKLKNKATQAELDEAYHLAFEKIDEAELVLGNSQRGFLMTAGIALTILLREGLEAFFVILAILGILQSMNAGTAIKWVHGGWITAFIFGIIGWFFAGSLMKWDAQSRELMEGLIALFAVIVLLYLGFWMHGHSNAAKWKAFVEQKVKGLLSQNNMIGLASFSFLVVFREAFESVLFLSSLTVDGSSTSKLGVFIGFIAAAILMFSIAWAMLKWFKKLPIGKVFLYSSMVILALAFVLAGNGIHAIQEGGYLDIRSFPINLKLSAIGLYPTYETIITQMIVLAMIFGLWQWSNRRIKKA